MQIALIQVTVLCGVRWAFTLGEQLGDGGGFGSSQVIERKLGVKPPTKDSECEQEDRHTDGEVTIAAIHIAFVAVSHSCVDSPSVYEPHGLMRWGDVSPGGFDMAPFN